MPKTPPRDQFSELVECLENWERRGDLKKATAHNLRIACVRIAEVLEPADKQNLAGIDVDDAIKRFHNLNPSIASSSLKTYRGRVRSAIGMFLDYKKDPVNWTPSIKGRSSRKKMSPVIPSGPSTTTANKGRNPDSHSSPVQAHCLTIPFPLRDDVTVEIVGIPRDLTTKEAERIAAFLRPLAIDYGENKG